MTTWTRWVAVVVAVAALGAGAAAGDEKPGALVVVVTAEDGGAPIAGAFVAAWTEEDTWTAKTDAEGRARIHPLPAGTVAVYAEAPGRTAEERQDVEVPAGGEASLALELGPGVPFQGRVTDPDGKPVADASVSVEAGGTFEGYSEMKLSHAPYARTWTDEAGRFRVAGIPPGAVGTVVVRSEGFEEARVAVRAVGDVVRPGDLVVRLERGSRVVGRVVGPDGAPVAGAIVYAIPADEEDMQRNPTLVRGGGDGEWVRATTATSDAEGRYAVEGLALGKPVLVAAEAEGFGRSAWAGPLVPTAERREMKADLALRRPGTVVVRVTDLAGKPVTDARVELGGSMTGLEGEPTGEAGVVRFTGLWPGEHALSVDKDGFLDHDSIVPVAEGATVETTVALDPGVAIEGVLLDEAGKPAAGMRVEAECKEPEPEGSGWHELTASRTETDAKGRFVLGGLRPGRHEVTVYGRNFDVAEPVQATAPATGLVVKGRRLGTVRLLLRAPEGAEVPRSAFVWRRQGGSGQGSGHKIEEGRMVFEGFRGPEELEIRIVGFVHVVRQVAAKPGEDLDLGTIVLDRGVVVKGRVVDPAGRPVVGASVSYGNYTESTTGADGRFSLPHVPAGKVRLAVGAEGFLDAEGEAEAGAAGEGPTLTIARGALVTGVVRGPDGAPLEDHWFRVERKQPGAEGAWKEIENFSTEEDGTFEVRVSAGPCRIAFYEERGATPVVLVEFEATEGGTPRHDLVLER